MIRFIHYGRWYYDHSSTTLPVEVREDTGQRDYPDRYVERGETVLIRPATPDEHRAMAARFDEVADSLARDGFVYGIGNFDRKAPPAGLGDALAGIKARARVEPLEVA